MTFSVGSRADELYPNLPCGNNQCDFFAGTPVPTGTTNANFALALGSSIAGTIRGPGGAPLQNARVEVWKGGERFGITFFTPASGAYTIGGLPTGNGFRVFARLAGFVAEVYPSSPCPAGGCPISNTGSPIDIATAGTTITGKDIELAPGHSISGTLSPAGSVATVKVFDSNGVAGQATNVIGSYTIGDLPDGSYKVRATMATRIAELYDNVSCPGACPLSLGTTVPVTGANVTGINFGLDPGRAIRGTVRGTNGDPVSFIDVEVVRIDGVVMSRGITFLDGVYASNNFSNNSEGLPAGSYRVRTRGPAGLGTYDDQIWNGHPCEPGCGPASGDPVVVSASADTENVDFTLTPGDLDFFTVVPCRAYDSRVGPPLSGDVTYLLRLEAKCGIPANAVAVSANVTVTSPTALGLLAIWPANLASPPPTSVLNVAAGQTRANNAVIPMSLVGLQNIALRGSLAGGGSFHAIIDVNGYFAQATQP